MIPGNDGHVGSIVVTQGSQTRVINAAYSAQRLAADGSLTAATLTEAEVKESFGTTLKVFAELKRRPLPDIVVIGHTDTMGSLPFNDRLSLARAERLREMMIELGIPAERITAAGRGKRELLVPTDDMVSEARNRRVEINVR